MPCAHGSELRARNLPPATHRFAARSVTRARRPVREADLPVELERAGMDDERARRHPRRGCLVDDADVNASRVSHSAKTRPVGPAPTMTPRLDPQQPFTLLFVTSPGRRMARTFPVRPPPQKKRASPSDSSPDTFTPGGILSRCRTSPVAGSTRRSSLSSLSHVPCQSSPSTHVTPVTKRSDSIVRRIAPVSGSI